MKRINIVTGHYGSGKTEFAINYAFKLRETYDNVVICDMDIVNPYFRTNDAKKMLNDRGITVISPMCAGTNLDLPSLPSEILSVFADKSIHAVLDVGGDEDGAIALGQYYPYLSQEDYEMFLVINANRPDTATVEDITTLADQIQFASRCHITAAVNNTNLSYLSSPEDVISAQSLIDTLCKKMQIEMKYITGKKENLVKVAPELSDRKFPLELFMKLPFDALA